MDTPMDQGVQMSATTTDSTQQASDSAGLTIRKVTGTTGVSVTGAQLNDEISDEVANALRDALYNNCVVVLPGQFLTSDAHMELAELFGEPWMPHYYASNTLEGYPKIALVENWGKSKAPAEDWHTDWSHMPVPPTVSIAVEAGIPDYGGDTMFSNQYEAYDRLSDTMKELLEGRLGTFHGSRPKAVDKKMEGTPETLGAKEKEAVINHHPIVQVHPESGRRALYLNRPGEALTEIEGFTEAESLPILKYLYEISSNPDNVYRHSWQHGDVVMWDNRCAMHYGVHDYGDVHRTLRRITVGGREE